jgi:2-dehydro-3-deoxyphosphooctonate aldolase (KDO 8-P synthase)
MTSIFIMQESGYPVVFDATHSAQIPGGGAKTGGQRENIPILAKAAVAAGCDGVFMEVHDQPDESKSDAATQWPLDSLDELLCTLLNIHKAVR